MEKVRNDLNKAIKGLGENNGLSMINDSVVLEAIKMLKQDKSDPFTDMTTNCLKEGTGLLVASITQLFQACAVHGYLPGELLIAKIIPLVKDPNGAVNSSENYRSICLSSIFLKIWDNIMLILFGDKLESVEMQFGFQKLAGTEMCTWALIESINFYTARGDRAYVCFMDCSKAFDKVNHGELFEKLIETKINPLFLRLLLYAYRHQKAKVSWEGIESES